MEAISISKRYKAYENDLKQAPTSDQQQNKTQDLKSDQKDNKPATPKTLRQQKLFHQQQLQQQRLLNRPLTSSLLYSLNNPNSSIINSTVTTAINNHNNNTNRPHQQAKVFKTSSLLNKILKQTEVNNQKINENKLLPPVNSLNINNISPTTANNNNNNNINNSNNSSPINSDVFVDKLSDQLIFNRKFKQQQQQQQQQESANPINNSNSNCVTPINLKIAQPISPTQTKSNQNHLKIKHQLQKSANNNNHHQIHQTPNATKPAIKSSKLTKEELSNYLITKNSKNQNNNSNTSLNFIETSFIQTSSMFFDYNNKPRLNTNQSNNSSTNAIHANSGNRISSPEYENKTFKIVRKSNQQTTNSPKNRNSGKWPAFNLAPTSPQLNKLNNLAGNENFTYNEFLILKSKSKNSQIQNTNNNNNQLKYPTQINLNNNNAITTNNNNNNNNLNNSLNNGSSSKNKFSKYLSNNSKIPMQETKIVHDFNLYLHQSNESFFNSHHNLNTNQHHLLESPYYMRKINNNSNNNSNELAHYRYKALNKKKNNPTTTTATTISPQNQSGSNHNSKSPGLLNLLLHGNSSTPNQKRIGESINKFIAANKINTRLPVRVLNEYKNNINVNNNNELNNKLLVDNLTELNLENKLINDTCEDNCEKIIKILDDNGCNDENDDDDDEEGENNEENEKNNAQEAEFDAEEALLMAAIEKKCNDWLDRHVMPFLSLNDSTSSLSFDEDDG